MGCRQFLRTAFGEPEAHPTGFGKLRKDQIRHCFPEKQHGSPLAHQNIPDGLPAQPQIHQCAEKIPVRQGILPRELRCDDPDGIE